jgi:hypothetical protein
VDCLDILERLERDLPLARDEDTQWRMALTALLGGTRADLVFAQGQDSGSEAPSDRQVGAWQSALWCAQITRALLEGVHGDEESLLVPLLDPVKLPIPVPRSAALVRLGPARSIWLVALRFPPGLAFQPTDLRFMSLVRNLFLQIQQHQEQLARSSEKLLGLVRGLIGGMDRRNQQPGHSERVARIAVQIGESLQLSAAECDDLYLAGLLHDAGRIECSDGPPPDDSSAGEDRQEPETHVLAGEILLRQVPELARLAPVIRHQHENFDGSGGPDGLVGEEIPLGARILALADAVDNEMSGDSACGPLDKYAMLALLMRGRGRLWDPIVVDAFLAVPQRP